MRKMVVLLFFTTVSYVVSGQCDLTQSSYEKGESITNEFGNFAYQYNHIVAKSPDNPLQVIVTVVFINGNSQTAITYRQDAVKGDVEWISAENGVYAKRGFVESITASIPPNHVVSWKYSYTLKSKYKEKYNIVYLDKAALMIMDDNFRIVKKTFKAESYKTR